MQKKWISAFAISLIATTQAHAETSIVPPGVRAFVYHHINAEVSSHYGANGVSSGFDINQKLGLNAIAAAVPAVNNVVTKLDPKLVDSIDFGTLDMKPDVRVNVDVFGGAFGVSKDFMLVGVVPVYNASTKISGSFEQTGSFSRAAQELEAQAAQPGATNTETISALSQVLRQLQAPNGNNVQAVLVNDLGYKPIGNWQGSGIGDLIFYGQLKTLDKKNYKQAFKVGAEVPTGRIDDPDNLVDIPFGKGHFVSFAESLNDFYVLDDSWILAVNGRLSYQWGHSATYRLAPDSDLPLTSRKGQVYRKPGNIGILDLHSEVRIVSDLYFHSDYIYTNKGKDKFSGDQKDYDYGILEKKTDQVSHVGEIGFSFSTVKLYMKNQFPAPFKLGMFGSRVLAGQNVDSVDMATLRFEMYF